MKRPIRWVDHLYADWKDGKYVSREMPGDHPYTDEVLGGFVDADGKLICCFGVETQYYPTEGVEPSKEDIIAIVNAVNDAWNITQKEEL